MLHGASVLLAPVNSAVGAVGGEFSNPEGWDLVLRFYAMMYGLPILMANRYGYEGEDFFWGGSRILDPHGRELAAASEGQVGLVTAERSEEHTSELQSLMRISYAVFCLKKKKQGK